MTRLLAIVVGELAPYRLHFHRRLARELAGWRLATITHFDAAPDGWSVAGTPEVGPVTLGDPAYAGASRVTRACRQFSKAAALARWLDEHSPAAVVVGGYAYLPARAAIRWANTRRVPVLLWADSNIHGDRAGGVKRIVKDAVLRRLLARVDALLACGSLGRAYFEQYGVPASRVFYVPNEPDYSLFEGMSPALIERARERFSLTPGRRRFVCSGRLIPLKRYGDVIDAFSTLADANPLWDVVIFGDGPMRGAWLARVPERLRPRVNFAGFVADQPLLAAAYTCADAMIVSSDYEAWSLVVNEACAAGLAVISSDVVGAAPELVHPAVNGVTYPAGDARALARAMQAVIDNIDAMKAASAGVLARWRRDADPVDGVRRALAHCGL